MIASVCCHGLTVVVFLATTAFRPEPAIRGEQILTLVPFKVSDRPGVGGLPPPVVTRTPSPQPSQLPKSVAPPAVTPPKVQTPQEVSRETRHTTPTPPPTHDTTPTREAAPKKHVVDVDLSHETHADKTSSKKATDNVQAQAAAHAAAQAAAQAKRANAQKLASEISSAFSELNSTVGSTASAEHDVAMLGEGGGEAFVNYRTAVFNAYYHAWRTPDQTTHSHAVVDAKIVVLRDGTVTSSEFVSKSGDSAVDRSVQRALDAVSHLPAFPAATQDVERTFIIRFDLEAKQEAG